MPPKVHEGEYSARVRSTHVEDPLDSHSKGIPPGSQISPGDGIIRAFPLEGALAGLAGVFFRRGAVDTPTHIDLLWWGRILAGKAFHHSIIHLLNLPLQSSTIEDEPAIARPLTAALAEKRKEIQE